MVEVKSNQMTLVSADGERRSIESDLVGDVWWAPDSSQFAFMGATVAVADLDGKVRTVVRGGWGFRGWIDGRVAWLSAVVGSGAE